MRRPVDLAPPSRAAQRKQRLLELENEQRIEDAKALKMTEVPPLAPPLLPLGQVRPTPAPQAHPHPHDQQTALTSVSMLRPQPQAPGFAVLTNACLASFSADDTICVRRFHSSFTLSSSPLPMPMPIPYSKTPKKSRSRVKGLFAFPARRSQSALDPTLPILIISIISSAPRPRLPPLSNFNSTCAAVCNSIRIQARKVHREVSSRSADQISSGPGLSSSFSRRLSGSLQVGTQASGRNRSSLYW
ncbi:hypothetical protein DFH09DRAFT_1324886 [Mycena vulgaris]|nr:hypothetical protein DFH09DRAFT_1324886 [Mycena vulgaris]